MDFVQRPRMRHGRRLRWVLVLVLLYSALCSVGGIYLADGTLHPARRALTGEETTAFTSTVRAMKAVARSFDHYGRSSGLAVLASPPHRVQRERRAGSSRTGGQPAS